jgi:tRNA (5-methylaminomethyl-2-thiouridylate)-methyltransferase
MDLSGKRVFVGLSGGVDSAVSAALLARAGAVVTGVFIKGWYPPGMPCTWREDRQDAMRVAARLRIPFLTLDASAEYKREVIDYLLAEYAAGRTPNPDIMCNREIKFGAFYRFAKEHGAAIATGHYRSGGKDQSYFLALVPKEILAAAIFPLGQMEKSEVRALAKRYDLPVAKKKDSQGVCFLGSISVKEFLKAELGDDPALLHTIGEKVNGKYVAGKEGGRLVLAKSRAPGSGAREIAFHAPNWVLAPAAADRAQYRYRGPVIDGRVDGGVFRASADLPEYPAPGQVIAFYRGRALAGGGIIDAYAA